MATKHCTVAQLLLLLSFTAPSVSVANPITGADGSIPTTQAGSPEASTSTQDEAPTATRREVEGTTLFDTQGASLLVITPSRSGSIQFGDGGSLVPDGVLASLGSGVSSSSLGNVSFTGIVPGSLNLSPTVFPEPSMLFLMAVGMGVGARRVAHALRKRRSEPAA